MSILGERIMRGYSMPTKLRVYRVVLYLLAALSANAGWLHGMVATMFLMLLFQSEIFENAIALGGAPFWCRVCHARYSEARMLIDGLCLACNRGKKDREGPA